MHTAELLWQRRQCPLLFDEVKGLSQGNWHDVGMHAALNYTDMEDLLTKKNVSSPVCQYFRFKAGENGKPKDLKAAICLCCKQSMTKQGYTTNLHPPPLTHTHRHTKWFYCLLRFWLGQYCNINFWITPSLAGSCVSSISVSWFNICPTTRVWMILMVAYNYSNPSAQMWSSYNLKSGQPDFRTSFSYTHPGVKYCGYSSVRSDHHVLFSSGFR